MFWATAARKNCSRWRSCGHSHLIGANRLRDVFIAWAHAWPSIGWLAPPLKTQIFAGAHTSRKRDRDYWPILCAHCTLSNVLA